MLQAGWDQHPRPVTTDPVSVILQAPNQISNNFEINAQSKQLRIRLRMSPKSRKSFLRARANATHEKQSRDVILAKPQR